MKITKGTILITAITLLTANFNAYGDSSKTRATIIGLKNKVELKYATSLWREANQNQMVRPGTIIRTGTLAKAELLYEDATIIRLGSRTTMVVMDKESREVKINSGNFWFKVTKKSHGLKIHLPKAVASIIGTEGGVKVDVVEETKNNKELNVSENDGVININNDVDKDSKEPEKANVTVVVAEGVVETKVANKNYSMTPGYQVAFSTTDTAKVDYNDIGIDKVRSLIESSEGDEIAVNPNPPVTDNSNGITNGITMVKIDSLKANMNVVKQMAENYAAENGNYTNDINKLIEDAKNKRYFKAIKNPFNGRDGLVYDYSKFNTATDSGLILYQGSDCKDGTCQGYKIYATEAKGKLLKYKGQTYILSNQ